MAVGQKIGDCQSVRVNVADTVVIVKGNFYLIQGWFGMAFSQKEALPAGQTADVVLNIEECEYSTTQINTGEAFAKGALLYFDSGVNNRFTTTSAGMRLVGKVTVAKDAGNVVYFKLLPQQA